MDGELLVPGAPRHESPSSKKIPKKIKNQSSAVFRIAQNRIGLYFPSRDNAK
jgi:hypothetical protein